MYMFLVFEAFLGEHREAYYSAALEMDNLATLRSLSSLLGDFFREFWRGILGGVREYLGGIWGGF